ncbi:MAG: DUF4440 domain-containing protein, partial [Pyrinomonadaceae bacterium]
METKDIELIEMEIRALERRWDEAHLHPETGALYHLMGDDFVTVSPPLNIYSKVELMEINRTSNADVSLEHYRSDIDRITVYEDVAIVI